MNPRQRRLRRQRRKARVRQDEAARLEVAEFHRLLGLKEQSRQAELRKTERAGRVKPSGGALLAAMSRQIKG